MTAEPLLDDGSNKTRADLRPRNSTERKGEPVHTGVMLYFPDALAAVARVSKAGNDKHNPGEPLHWARGKSMDQSDCVGRHMLTPDVPDPDSGEAELAHAAWRILAQLQLAEERRLSAAGIMPYSGIVPAPAEPPCHARPKEQWCDRQGAGGFMGHTCK